MRILIADEEPTHSFLLEMFLKKWGYEVISTDSGIEAWQILQQENSPPLAILEWQLPGMGGIEICRQVKRTEERPRYILLLTARAQKADILMGLSAGADDYMAKPYDPKELQGRLFTACQTVHPTANSTG